MHKVILMMLLAVVSSSALAEWVVVGGDDSLILYVDPASIRKSGNKVKMWHLYDLNRPEKTTATNISYMSEKGQRLYDCKEEQTLLTTFTYFSENMGQGSVVYIGNDNDLGGWKPVGPGSMAEVLWKIACGKR